MRKLFLSFFLCSLAATAFGKAIIDRDVLESVKRTEKLKLTPIANTVSLIVFLHTAAEKTNFLQEVSQIHGVNFQELDFMPAVALTIPAEMAILTQIARYPGLAQISSIKKGTTELEISTQALKLVPSEFYPEVKNWWAHGYTGSKGVIGLIDDGVDPHHPALANKMLITPEKTYLDFYNGVRSAHGTGVACIYASKDQVYKGIAYGANTIVSGLSGEETDAPENIIMTLGTLDWMLGRAKIKPTIINYSMGNGHLACTSCPEWSGLAKVIDFVINHGKILWVKSAGNDGSREPSQDLFASSLTVPSDNYNGLTVANMNTVVTVNGVSYKTADRSKHTIRATSSRGPTPSGRRKPDITAPGHDTRTCAPDPQTYRINYSPAMDYHDGYRLMGGTSAAAPHVGAAALLLQDAGINNPMAIKALLINSADAWTDSGDSFSLKSAAGNNHFEVMGSEWNRTYGWGYLNMEKAFAQRNDIIEDELTVKKPVQVYQTILEVGDKVTLVHERRVGYFAADNSEWQLSHLSLELIDIDTHQLIAKDDSAIDTVHQVANCNRLPGQKSCSAKDKTIRALVRVKLLSPTIHGSTNELFVLVLKKKKEDKS